VPSGSSAGPPARGSVLRKKKREKGQKGTPATRPFKGPPCPHLRLLQKKKKRRERKKGKRKKDIRYEHADASDALAYVYNHCCGRKRKEKGKGRGGDEERCRGAGWPSGPSVHLYTCSLRKEKDSRGKGGCTLEIPGRRARYPLQSFKSASYARKRGKRRKKNGGGHAQPLTGPLSLWCFTKGEERMGKEGRGVKKIEKCKVFAQPLKLSPCFLLLRKTEEKKNEEEKLNTFCPMVAAR